MIIIRRRRKQNNNKNNNNRKNKKKKQNKIKKKKQSRRKTEKPKQKLVKRRTNAKETQQKKANMGNAKKRGWSAGCPRRTRSRFFFTGGGGGARSDSVRSSGPPFLSAFSKTSWQAFFFQWEDVSGVTPANQTKDRSVHELFAAAFRNKSSMWIVLVFPQEKHQKIHKKGRNSWTFRFGPFFGLVGRGDSWKNFMTGIRSSNGKMSASLCFHFHAATGVGPRMACRSRRRMWGCRWWFCSLAAQYGAGPRGGNRDTHTHTGTHRNTREHTGTHRNTQEGTIDSVQTRCIVKGEAQKSPLFWRFSGGFWFSQDRLFSQENLQI